MSAPSMSVDQVTHGGRVISFPNTTRSHSVNPSMMSSGPFNRAPADDDDDEDVGLSPVPGGHRRESLNPALAAGMLDQIRHLFKSLSIYGDKSESEKTPAQQRSYSSASVSNMKDMLSLGEDVEDDVHYLEACESAEGPPSRRVFACLNYRVLNCHGYIVSEVLIFHFYACNRF